MGHQWYICFIANITLTVAGKLNTQIKELQARLEELDEELESERAARARATTRCSMAHRRTTISLCQSLRP